MCQSRWSRILSVLLTVLMLASTFPAVALAAGEVAAPADKPDTAGQPAWPAEGSVNLTKAARETNVTEQWELTLGIEGKNSPEKADVVMVLDNSHSMSKDVTIDGKSTTRLAVAKTTAKAFIEDVWEIGSNVRFALVVFGSELLVRGEWYDSNNKEALLQAIDDIKAHTDNQTTNIQAGLHRASELLTSARSDASKNIVLLSDGAPTKGYAFKVDAEGSAPAKPEPNYEKLIGNGHFRSSHAMFAANAFHESDNDVKGYYHYTGKQYTGEFKYVKDDSDHDLANVGYKYYGTDFGHQTVWEAEQIKALNVAIFSIGFHLGDTYQFDNATEAEAQAVLIAVSSTRTLGKDVFFVDNEASAITDLSTAYAVIATEITHPAQNGVVTDVMGENVQLVQNHGGNYTNSLAEYQSGAYDIYVSHGSATYDTATYCITWAVGTVYEAIPTEMRYRVELREGAQRPADGEWFPTNEFAYFDYTNYKDEDHVVKPFPVPEVVLGDKTFSVVHIQTDQAGKPSHQEGKTETYKLSEHPNFNITEHVSDDHLYGGTFTDEACTEVAKFGDGNPLNFRPVADETYYIWEVKEQYLLPYAFRAWYTTENGELDLSVFHILTPVDRLLYREVGFAVTEQGAERDIPSEKDGENIAYGTVEMTYSRVPGRIDLLYLSDGWMNQQKNWTGTTDEAKDNGYIAVHTLTEDEFAAFKADGKPFSFVPYWITLDGVRVTGVVKRECTYTGTNNVEYSFEEMTSQKTYAEPVAPAMAVRAISYMPVFSFVADASPLVTVTINDNGNTYTVSAEKGDNLTGTLQAAGATGKLFAGWYTDAAYTTPADFSSVQTDMTVYAKYVSNVYLRVKYVQQGLFFARNVAFVSAVDGGDYREVGILVNGEKLDIQKIGNSYGVIHAGGRFGMSWNSSLMVGYHSLSGYPYDEKLTVTAYWITADGTTVCGETRTLTHTRFGLRG